MGRALGMIGQPAHHERVLPRDEWRERARTHRERVRVWTDPLRARRSRHESHPVHDFLFQYYWYPPKKLEAWHPNPGEAIEDTPEAREAFAPPVYRSDDGVIRRDLDARSQKQKETAEHTLSVLEATARRPANLGCFGVHEWAMVYRGHDVRHETTTDLRLPQAEIDAFVEARPMACTHFEAFRFFAPDAKPMNRLQLDWETQHEMEQPGCVHANMDLYRWAFTSMPWVGTDILWDCFQLATDLRDLDMRASPYDLSDLGFAPIRVETAKGQDTYRRLQKSFADRAEVLRARLIHLLATSLDETARPLAPLNTPA